MGVDSILSKHRTIGNGGTILNVDRNKARKRLVVVGNGMAGARVVEEILKRSPDQFDIVMFGAEPYGNYNRILLSNVLNGSQQATDIFINPLSWYRDNNIRLHAGVKASHIDRKRRVVVGAPLKKDSLAYSADAEPEGSAVDRRALRPRHHRDGLTPVCSSDGRLRRDRDFSLPNDRRLLAYCGVCARSAGARPSLAADLLGLEAARGLLSHGVEVTVLEAGPQLMMAQLDPEAGDMLLKTIEAMGIHVRCNTITTKISRADGRISHLEFKDGSMLGNRHGRCQHRNPPDHGDRDALGHHRESRDRL